jgi:hypothetical protein
MNSFTRIGLPILLVAGVVFGITFILMYSPEDVKDPTTGKEGQQVSDRQMLKFYTTKAAVSTPTSTPKHLWYWDSTVEVGAPGHFEFWCSNKHEQPVTIWVPATNCQCAGAEMTNVPPDAMTEYTLTSALAGNPLLFGVSSPFAALAHQNLNQKLTWVPLFKGDVRPEQTIPAAKSPAEPQFAMVRLAWTGKGEPGIKAITAEVYARKGDDKIPSRDVIAAETQVVAAFEPMRREGARFVSARELPFGELHDNGVVKQTIYLVSFTRQYLLYSTHAERPTPCITWTEPVPVNDEEFYGLTAQARGAENNIRRVKSAYKFEITVRERADEAVGAKTEVHRLDLGPLDRKISVDGVEAGSWTMLLRGRVLGEITMPNSEEGRIDLATFPSDLGASKEVSLLAERPGLDLELLSAETTPNYLQVKLEPRKDIDGRKQWLLRVTVPKGALHGSLPESSAIVLKTTGANSRRLRIPIRGMTFDSGKPQL